MNTAIINKCCNKKSVFFPLFALPNHINIKLSKSISTSSVLCGKRNFRKFLYFDRGTPQDRQWYKDNPEEVDQRGMRLPGFWKDKKLEIVPEMIPELVVPDLTNFPLKPYVSYRTKEFVQEKFTPEHLFYAAYSKKIKKDLEEGNLDEEGNPLEPSSAEKMTAEEAWQKARASGSDLFG